MITGNIHSIESMGLLDGPGIRTVVFLQGCSLRCKFCHNPDTWNMCGGRRVSPEAVMSVILRYKPYFVRSGGGVTFSGGEPLMQPDFLLELLRLCKINKIHTCLDTAGCGIGRYDEILALTDLVLYDVKQCDREKYKALTGKSQAETEVFLAALKKSGVPTIVRHVVMPGVSDSDAEMKKLNSYIHDNVPSVEAVELLPYHLLGVNKYEKLGINYPLSEMPAMDILTAKLLQDKFFGDINIKEACANA